METPKISVLISMYKGEQTLSRMIDCVLAQTFKDFELILIDDGSPDRCGEIAEEYAAKDSRARVLHKSNGGLSDARNHGLAIAKGEYTIQFDQDDYVDNTCLEELYAKAIAEDADMVICDCYNGSEQQQSYGKQQPTALNHEAILENMLTGKLYGYMWNKMIKRECFAKYNIKFPTEIYGCEDQYAMCELLKNDVRIAYLPRAFYHYIYNESSLSRYYDEKTYENDKKTRDMFAGLLKGTPCEDLAYVRKTSYMFGRAFMYGNKYFTSKSFRKEFLPYKELIFSVPRSKYFNFFYHMSFAGFFKTARLLYGVMFYVKHNILNKL